jgi:Ca-activated chloride channel family protein
MLRFEHSAFLYFLGLIPILYALYRLQFWLWKRHIRQAGDLALMRALMPDFSPGRKAMRFWLLMTGLAMLFIGLANPQTGAKLEKAERRGIDLVIALDVSNSMLAEDIKPNRISRARQSISRLIDRLSNDRIGMVVFAGKAYTQLPITSDYAAAKLFLNSIDPSIVPSQGTAIGEAIRQSMEAFGESENSKAIIIITDGENHEDNAVEIAGVAVEKGIKVYTIGMGTLEGAPIPEYRGKLRVGFKKDKAGSTVVTRLNEVMMQQIAAAGDGIYVRASNTEAGLEKIFEAINKLDKSTFDARIFSDYEDQFQFFLALAIFFLVMEILIVERRSRWFRSFSLFNFELKPGRKK